MSLSANAARFGKINFDDLNWERRKYSRKSVYAASKLAVLLFTAELQRRLTTAKSGVLATAAHPGAAVTDALKNSGGEDGLMIRIVNRFFARTPAAAALETLYASVADIPGNSFVGPAGGMRLSGAPKLVKAPKAAQDPELARRLWDISAKMTKISPTLTLA